MRPGNLRLFRRQRGKGYHHHRRHGVPHGRARLSDLEPGQRARIIRIGGRGRCRRRFMEMGLVGGETVLVERVAPLGDPIEFFVKGYHVSLRRSDAQHIEVQMLGEGPGKEE
jgi:ferrous iron transport protein A